MLRAKRYTRTEPSTEPVTGSELAEHLRVSYSDHDRMLDDLATAARKVAEEQYLWRVLITQTCVDYFDDFDEVMELHWSPAQSITSITYLDPDGELQTLSTDVYELGVVHGAGIVRLKYSQTYPSTRGHEDVITVTYVAGYGTADDVPLPIRQWIKIRAAWMYLYPAGEERWSEFVDGLLGGYADQRVLA